MTVASERSVTRVWRRPCGISTRSSTVAVRTARALLDDAARRAADFAVRYGGRVLQLDAPEFAAAAQEWSGIRETMMRAFLYASLSHQRDLSDAAAGALYGLVAERRSAIEQKLRFFELEWGAGSHDAVERLLADAGPEVEFAAHHLRRVHDAAGEQLSVAEEWVLSETSATSRFAWVRLANELISEVQCEGREGSEDALAASARAASPAECLPGVRPYLDRGPGCCWADR